MTRGVVVQTVVQSIVQSIVGAFVVLLSTSSHAQPVKVSRDIPAAAPAGQEADRAFVESRSAFVRGDLSAFDAAARRVARDHPLRSYVESWRLRLSLRQPQIRNRDALQATNAAPIDEPAIRGFLAANADTVVADLLRRDWLLELGRQKRWTDFDHEYPRWILQDDQRVHCLHWLSRLEQGRSTDGARQAIASARDLVDGCADLLAALVHSGRMNRTDVRARLLAGVETLSRETIERTSGLLGVGSLEIARAWDKPSAALVAPTGSETALIALARLARTDPRAAAARLSQPAESLPLSASDRAFAWAQVAAAGMRRLEPESHDWTLRALDAPVGDATLEWMARAALRARDWPTLGKLIDRMSERGRREPAWAYWHARALIAQGASESGKARLRDMAGGLHFYGQLAAEELGESFRLPVSSSAPDVNEADLERAAGRPGIGRAVHLYSLDLRLDGNREWNFALRGLDDRELIAIARWACQRGILDRCVNTAERTRREHDFQLRFVTPFRDQLTPVSERHGLDQAWLYALIRQESRFTIDARSSAGAQGLMQIMPATGRWIAGKLGVKDFRVHHLNDPGTNLQFGTYYLRSVMDDLGGSQLLALAAYNAGPGRPKRWRAALPEPVEGAIFAEIIPFSETRDYVKQVLSSTTLYAQVLNGETRSLKSMLGSVRPQSAPDKETP